MAKRSRKYEDVDFSDLPDTMDLEEFLAVYEERIKGPKKKKRGKKTYTDWEATLLQQITAVGLPAPSMDKRIKRFAPPRKWEADFIWPDYMLMAEVHGGNWGNPIFCNHCKKPVQVRTKDGRLIQMRGGGAHNRGKGFRNNREKTHEAILLGYTVFEFVPEQIESGEALNWLERWFNAFPRGE